MIFSQEWQFSWPFSQVAKGLWFKYPNPHSSQVVSVDVISRSVDHDGVLRTERIIGVRQNAPSWLVKLVGGSQDAYVREVIFVSPTLPSPSSPSPSPSPHPPPHPHPSVCTVSHNLTMSQVISCRELISYAPSPDDEAKATVFSQVADMRAKGKLASGGLWSALGKKVETWALDRFATNAAEGRKGFDHVLNQLFRATGEVCGNHGSEAAAAA